MFPLYMEPYFPAPIRLAGAKPSVASNISWYVTLGYFSPNIPRPAIFILSTVIFRLNIKIAHSKHTYACSNAGNWKQNTRQQLLFLLMQLYLSWRQFQFWNATTKPTVVNY
ncbi:hypothetical protein VPH35_023819 [Triticum aestivum]